MSNIPPSRDRMVSTIGAVLNGAKRYFYTKGTTTPIATYTTRLLAVQNAHPVVADAYGLFGPIWITPGTNYREVLEDSAGNTLYDVDDQYPLTVDGASLSTQVYETAENPNHYDAIGTGSVDETSEVQDAIDAAVANSREGVVDLMGRVYRCDSALTLYSGLTIRNGTLDFSNCTADDYIKAIGSFGSPVSLGSNASAAATSVTLTSTATLSVGDWLMIDDSAGALNGEIVRVKTVDTATDFTAFSAVNDPYTTANSARVREITPITDIKLRDLAIIANPAASAGRIIRLDRVIGAVIDNVRFSGHKRAAIEVRTSVDVRIANCSIRQTTTGGTFDMGVNVCDASRGVQIYACSLSGQATGVQIGVNTSGGSGGVTRDVVVRDCEFDDCNVVASVQSEYVAVSGCSFAGGSVSATAISVSGYSTTIIGNQMHGSNVGPVMVSCDYTSNRSTAAYNRRLVIANNTCYVTSATLMTMTGATRAIDRLSITGNITDNAGITATFTGSATVNHINISNNELGTGTISLNASAGTGNLNRIVIAGNTTAGVAVYGNATNYAFYAAIGNNSISATAARAIDLQKVSQTTVAGNTVVGSGSFAYGVYVLNAADAATGSVICGNAIYASAAAATSSAIRVDDTDNVTITGNMCDGASFSNGIYVYANTVPAINVVVAGNTVNGIAANDANSGIRIEGDAAANPIRRPVVTGNSVLSAGRAVRLEGDIEGGVVTGNSLESGAATNSVVFLNGRAAGTMNNAVVSGNAIREGVFGLEVANVAETIHDGNSFYSNSTGILSGAVSTAGDSA